MGKTFLLFCMLSLCSLDLALANNIRRVAMIDTEFCVANIHIPTTLKNRIIINPSPSTPRDCGKSTPKERWAHGHHVLKIFIKELARRLPNDLVMEIYPYNVFASDGQYTLKNWQEMLKTLMGISPDVIIMASTYYGPDHVTLEQSVNNFHGLFLLSAGAMDETIKDPNFLWPQSSKLVQKILFGTYIHYQTQGQKGAPQGQLDTDLLEQNGLDFVVQSPNASIYPTGSSYAVAYAAGRLLPHCFSSEKTSFLRCIEGFSSQILLKSPNFKTGKIYKALSFSK